MADILTRADILAEIKAFLAIPAAGVIYESGVYALHTDRIAALALVLRELPAEPAPPVVEAPVVEPAPVQDPECPYPPIMTQWGLTEAMYAARRPPRAGQPARRGV